MSCCVAALDDRLRLHVSLLQQMTQGACGKLFAFTVGSPQIVALRTGLVSLGLTEVCMLQVPVADIVVIIARPSTK